MPRPERGLELRAFVTLAKGLKRMRLPLRYHNTVELHPYSKKVKEDEQVLLQDGNGLSCSMR